MKDYLETYTVHLNFTAATFDTILAGHSILHSPIGNPTILQSRNFIVKISYCQICSNLQLDYNRWNVRKTDMGFIVTTNPDECKCNYILYNFMLKKKVDIKYHALPDTFLIRGT